VPIWPNNSENVDYLNINRGIFRHNQCFSEETGGLYRTNMRKKAENRQQIDELLAVYTQ
jgi:hypothetical protein